MEDPREIHSDDALSKLTDDEKIVSDDSGDECEWFKLFYFVSLGANIKVSC